MDDRGTGFDASHDGVGHRLGGGGERGGRHALGHPSDHESGPHEGHPNAGTPPAQSASPWEKASSPALEEP